MRYHRQVRRGGKLELVGIDVVNSTGSSAVFSEGRITVTNCSFVRCVTGPNGIMRSLDGSIISGGAALRALGGAIQVHGGKAALQSTYSSFVECAAHLANYGNYGGAVYAAAMVRIDTSRFEANYVQGGSGFEGASGGALFSEARRLDITESEFVSNKAKGPGFAAYGGAIFMYDCTTLTDQSPDFCTVAPTDCGAQLRAVTFMRNVASGGSSRAKAGAIYMANQGLCVNVTASSFEANSAEDSEGNTEGGAVLVYGKSVLKIATTRFVGNTAKRAADQVRGGAINIAKAAIVEVVRGVTFEGNIARDGGNTNQGGAISLKESSSLRVKSSTRFVKNSVIGKNPNGGALWIFTAKEASIFGAAFEGNMMRLKAEYGYGGALHVESSKMLVVACGFDSNVALLDSVEAAYGATAGGISVWKDAELTLLDTSFSANQAGGIGTWETTGDPGKDRQRVVRAAHILSQGITVADRCLFTSTAPISLPYSAPWWIVGTAAGRITLVNSTFRAPAADQVEGMLSLADDAAALLRSCTGSNVMVDLKVAGGNLGIVDSTFAPALGSSLQSIAPPACGTEVAGQRMCDPRARCTHGQSGGVECQCKGEGVEPHAGVRDDGSHCATIVSLEADVAARAVQFVLLKPGKHPDPLKLHAIATGDAGFNVTYSRSTVLRRDGSAVAQSDDGLHARVFGLSFEWVSLQPRAVASMALDAAKNKYSTTVEDVFRLSLQCAPNATGGLAGNGTNCPQDGDVIETTISVTQQAGNVTLRVASEVQISTAVQAAISCERTKPTVRVVANTDLNSILPAAPLSVYLLAMDMDDQSIRFSRAEVVLTWDGVAVPFDWVRGLNKYTWEIPPNRPPGQHEIFVNLEGSNCTLLRLTVTVTVEEGFNTAYVTVGCLIGAAILVIALFLLIRRYRVRFEAVFEMVFVEVLKATLGWFLDAGDLTTDAVSFHRTVVSNEVKAGYIITDRYKIAYIVTMCVSAAAAAVSFAYRVKATRDLFQSIRRRVSEPEPAAKADEANAAEALKDKLTWELAKTRRDLLSVAIHMLTVIFEDIPFITLNCCLIFSEGITDSWMFGSTLISALLLGNRLHTVNFAKQVLNRRAEAEQMLVLLMSHPSSIDCKTATATAAAATTTADAAAVAANLDDAIESASSC